jgi:hypothetical protein
MAHVNSLVCEGVFERFPNLQFVGIEGGIGWLPHLMWRMDKNWKALRELTHYGMFASGHRVLRLLNVDQLLIGAEGTLSVESVTTPDERSVVVIGDWRSNHANGLSRFEFVTAGDRVASMTIREG